MGECLITRRDGGKSEGLYVWSKNTFGHYSVTNPSFHRNSNKTITSTSFNVKQVNEEFFDGFYFTDVDGDKQYYSYIDGVLYFSGMTYGKKGVVASYDPSTATLTGFNGDIDLYYVGTKEYGIKKQDFIGYVVSDEPNKYPNGAVHTDGYYYERVGEGISPQMFGCTKMAVDEFTVTSRTRASSYSISHGLGVIPKFVFLIAETLPSVNNDIYLFLGSNIKQATSFDYVDVCYYGNGMTKDTASIHSITTTSLIFYSSYYYTAGVKYTVITMA